MGFPRSEAGFADTSYYLAFLNADDELHPRAATMTPTLGAGLVTTAWVLTELVDAFSRPALRPVVIGFVEDLVRDPEVTIVPASQELFDRGFELFKRRPDKEWSLTDCISFVVMEERGIAESLTADHHFEQAGFRVLL